VAQQGNAEPDAHRRGDDDEAMEAGPDAWQFRRPSERTVRTVLTVLTVLTGVLAAGWRHPFTDDREVHLGLDTTDNVASARPHLSEP
jgi:hypothetical protein